MRYILFLSLPLYALDQWSKQLILRFIDPDQPRILVSGFFSLVNVTNTGAAFGSFRNNNTFFIAISLIALLIVVVLLVRRRARIIWCVVSIELLFAGFLGNLTDRIHFGYIFALLFLD